jgi:hypothetical protein
MAKPPPLPLWTGCRQTPLKRNSDEEDKTDIEQDEIYLKLNEEAEQLFKKMLKGIETLCINYLINLSEAGLITLTPKEEG